MCLAGGKIGGKLIHVISIYPIAATANLITHYEYICGRNSKNEVKMKERHCSFGLETEGRI